jgi:Spy/CpxP family protein refolding chaperone
MRHLARLALFALVLAAPLGASTALAQGPRGHGRHGMHAGDPDARFERRVQHVIGSLGLDEAQATQVRQFMTEARAQHQALRGQALTEDQRREAHRQIMESTGQRIRAILRPDQQRAFDFHVARMRERGERMRERHGRGGAAPHDGSREGI